MLATQPVIQLLSLYQAFNFGVFYLIISGFPPLWEKRYGLPKGEASLNYIALASGSLIGVNICGPVTDAMYAYMKKRRGIAADQPGLPEFRVPLMIPAAILSPCGIFLFAWSAEAKLHFLLPDVSSSFLPRQCLGSLHSPYPVSRARDAMERPRNQSLTYYSLSSLV